MAEKKKKLVFDNTRMESLITEFCKTGDFSTYQKICEGSLNLIDSIICAHRFYKQVEFSDIRNFLVTQIEKWIRGWTPGKSKAYSYFCTCIKNAGFSYVGKEKQFRDRYVVTDLPMETFGDMEAPEGVIFIDDEIKDEIKKRLADIHYRWNEPVIREIIRYLVCAIFQNRIDRRKEIIKSIMWGYSVSIDTAKFLVDWTQGVVRATMLEYYDQPLGDIDILRASDKFSFLPDMINLIGIESTKKMMSVFAGVNVKFPTLAQIKKLVAVQELFASNETPADALRRVSKKHRVSPAKLQEGFQRLSENVQEGLLTDEPLYDEEEDLSFLFPQQ
jgi:hypothetical protein